jgi:hypothetical protein
MSFESKSIRREKSVRALVHRLTTDREAMVVPLGEERFGERINSIASKPAIAMMGVKETAQLG